MLGLVSDRPEAAIVRFAEPRLGRLVSSPVPRKPKSASQITPHLVQTPRLVERTNRIGSVLFVAHDKLLELCALLLGYKPLRSEQGNQHKQFGELVLDGVEALEPLLL